MAIEYTFGELTDVLLVLEYCPGNVREVLRYTAKGFQIVASLSKSSKFCRCWETTSWNGSFWSHNRRLWTWTYGKDCWDWRRNFRICCRISASNHQTLKECTKVNILRTRVEVSCLHPKPLIYSVSRSCSCLKLGQVVIVSKDDIKTVLKEYLLHPYHIQSVQALLSHEPNASAGL